MTPEIKLSRRLNKLLKISERVELDTSYITCAEYQLFIDERLKTGEYYQPDHWKNHRFPTGDANKPITGIRASDAKAFCEWLTQRAPLYDSSCISVENARYRYRLPSLAEAEEYSSTEKNIGCWCNAEESKAIAGIDLEQWQAWKLVLTNVLLRDLDFDLVNDLDLPLYLDCDRVRNRDIALDRVRNRNLEPIRNRDFELTRFYHLNLAQFRNCAHDLIHSLDRFRHLNSDLVLTLDLTRDLDRALVRAHTFSSIRSYLLLIHIIWDLLLDVLEKMSINRYLSVFRNLNRREFENLICDYVSKRDQSFHFYAFFVLIDERRVGRLPAWEGIRIVREREM